MYKENYEDHDLTIGGTFILPRLDEAEDDEETKEKEEEKM